MVQGKHVHRPHGGKEFETCEEFLKHQRGRVGSLSCGVKLRRYCPQSRLKWGAGVGLLNWDCRGTTRKWISTLAANCLPAPEL